MTHSSSELRKLAQEVVGSAKLAIFTTASADGVPHATWMGAFGGENLRQVLTITSPNSVKICNLRENPRAEWMFTSINREIVVYLSGAAEVIDDVAMIKEQWERVPNKVQAFFLGYTTGGLGINVLRTIVEDLQICWPQEARKISLDLCQSAG